MVNAVPSMMGRSHAPRLLSGSSRSTAWPTRSLTAAPLSANVSVWPAGNVAVGATFGVVGVGDAVPGEALGGGAGLLRMGVTVGIGEATVDASGGQVDETGDRVVSDAGGVVTERGADAMIPVAGDTGNAEDGSGGAPRTWTLHAVAG